jgi:hypothetical protein
MAHYTSSPDWKADVSSNPRDGGWDIYDDNAEGRIFATVTTKQQRDYALLLLANGGIDLSDPDNAAQDLLDAVGYNRCTRCNAVLMSAQLDAAGRGPECQS